MTAEEAFLYPDDDAEVEMPFVLNDIKPMSNEEIRFRVDEISGKYKMRLGAARNMN